jgi:hypothetical protein
MGSGERRDSRAVTTREPITGKVARVLNTRELVINRGSAHGVKRGTVFEVLDPDGSDIPDPDSGEIIGSVFRPKVRVRVTDVQPELAVASTYRTRRMNVGGAGALGAPDLSTLFRPPKWVEVPETFKAEDVAWEKIPAEKSFVKVGDPVREVFRARRQGDDETLDEEGEAEELTQTGSEPAE